MSSMSRSFESWEAVEFEVDSLQSSAIVRDGMIRVRALVSSDIRLVVIGGLGRLPAVRHADDPHHTAQDTPAPTIELGLAKNTRRVGGDPKMGMRAIS